MKQAVIILITLLLCLSFTACTAADYQEKDTASVPASAGQTADTSAPTASAEQASAQAVYETEYGTVYYPSVYQDSFAIKQENDDEGIHLTFTAEVDKKEYRLFTLLFSAGSEEDGIAVITDKNGVSHSVFAEVEELAIDDLSEDAQNQLYAMQESINDIIDALQ